MGIIPKEPPSAEELSRRGIGAKAKTKAKVSAEKPAPKKRGRPPKKKE